MENVDLSNAIIIDVRNDYEFEEGNIPNSINIPLHEVPHKIQDFKDMKGEIVLCCKSGNRSGQAQQYLASQGVQNLHNGGGWEELLSIMNDKS